MSCREYESGRTEWARGGELDAAERQALMIHLEHCAECASRLDAQRAYQAAIEQLAAEVPPLDGAVEARVLAEFDRVAGRQQAKVSRARWLLGVGLAASVVLAALLTLLPSPVRRAVSASPLEAQFVPIPYSIPLAPEERAEIVRMRIPVTALLAAGYHVDVGDPSVAIDADVVVSQDGRVRAVRPLTVTISD